MGRGLSNLVNAVDTELAASVAPSDLTITVVDASELPVAPFYLVIDPFGDTTREYLYCTSVAAEVLTVLRDISGSQDTTHASGDIVRISVTEQNVQDLWERTLASISDVSIDTPQVFDFLAFDPVTSVWKNLVNLANFGIVTLPYVMASPYDSTPGATFISPNNALAANVSLITVNEVGLAPEPFNEYGFLWDGLSGGDTIRLQSATDPDAWANFAISDVTLRSAQYYDLTISGLIEQGSTYPPADGTQMLVYVFHTAFTADDARSAVDDGTYLKLLGGTMLGDLDMEGNDIDFLTGQINDLWRITSSAAAGLIIAQPNGDRIWQLTSTIVNFIKQDDTTSALQYNINNDFWLFGTEVRMGDFKITGLADPTDPQDAATKAYVDGGFLAQTGGPVTGDQALSVKLVRNITVSPTEPSSPAIGDIWMDNS